MFTARPGGQSLAVRIQQSDRPETGLIEAVLFDRDGTLIHDVPYDGDPTAVAPVPGAREALDRLRAAGPRLGAAGVLVPTAGARPEKLAAAVSATGSHCPPTAWGFTTTRRRGRCIARWRGGGPICIRTAGHHWG
jgi:hypothetical protein